LEVANGVLPAGAWARIVEVVSGVVANRAALFTDPTLVTSPEPASDGDAGEASPAPMTARLEIYAGHVGATPPGVSAPCLESDFAWTARFGRDFLEASAERMLEAAPTTPGIDADVTLEWFPEEFRVRTLLAFAGPLDIPNGRCWVDDVLSVDEAVGLAVASGEQGLATSPFAEGACGRFFGYLPDGGAGEQAITLLPAEVELEGGGMLRFVATDVSVRDDAIVVGGRVELR
jgi:hypothetical protein